MVNVNGKLGFMRGTEARCRVFVQGFEAGGERGRYAILALSIGAQYGPESSCSILSEVYTSKRLNV